MKLPTLLLLASVVGIAMHLHEIRDNVADYFSKTRWLEDEERALSDAKSDNRFVLLRFEGSDWCGVCKAMNREVFSTDEFKEMAAEKFVLVDIDFPHHKSQSGSRMQQNSDLAKHYEITGVPTVIVLNSNGVVLKRMGYHPGAPEDFLAELKKFRHVGAGS